MKQKIPINVLDLDAIIDAACFFLYLQCSLLLGEILKLQLKKRLFLRKYIMVELVGIREPLI